MKTCTHTHNLSGTTQMGWYQEKHSLTHTHPDHQTSLINFLHLLWSIASSLFWIYVLDSPFPQPVFRSSLVYLGLEPCTTYSIHFFTQTLSTTCQKCITNSLLFKLPLIYFKTIHILSYCSCDLHNRWNNTHTHPFNGPLSETTRVSRYQKGNTNLDFTEARDSEWQWHQLHLTPDR